MSKGSLAKLSRSEVAAIVDKEALPFIRLNEKAIAAGRQPPFRDPKMEAIRYELVTRPDGTIVKQERSKPLVACVGEVCNQWMCDTRRAKTDGEKVFGKSGDGNHCTDFAKYHDEARLDFSQPCSVEVGEITSWRSE